MAQVVRGVILNPKIDRSVDLITDGVLAASDDGRLTFVGHWNDFVAAHGPSVPHERVDGLILPGMLDLHTHVPQFPIRGDFSRGISENDPRGVLLASLQTNVFPEEMRFGNIDHADRVIRDFAVDTAANGVIGGCAFFTAHPAAARRALEVLPSLWHGGLVLMNQNCPGDLCTPDAVVDDIAALSRDFGPRHVITDRFAVATTAELRRKAAAVAREAGAMTQTHLNEQLAEKAYVEDVLYPQAKSYTHVYLDDGLLDTRAILAHCIQMTPPEWEILADKRCVVAHCPTSNACLNSGVMKLDEVLDYRIDYALCTDVGASPTTSLAAEMAVFLLAHHGRSRHATACEALYRTTLGPARILGIDHSYGHFAVGAKAAWSAWPIALPAEGASAEELLRSLLLPESQLPDLGGGPMDLHALQHWISARRAEPSLRPVRVEFC